MNKRKSLLWVGILLVATILILVKHNNTPYQQNHGLVFGTIYNITYQYPEDLKTEIEAELQKFDNSLSPFNKQSTITRVNQNQDVTVDAFFQTCFERSMQLSKATQGAFDITVAPLVNAWGFGFKQGQFPDSAYIDSLLQFTGYEKVKLVNKKVVKEDPRIMLNCSAVAKGYSVDVIARLLDAKDIKNYMVDIGGEVIVKGLSTKRAPWRIGINKPVEDSLSTNNELQAVITFTNAAMATSGNYRNFYYKGGKKYAHTINPATGYPIEHNLLSATVLAKDCMTADALATSFMVMGLEKAQAFLQEHHELEAYFIYTDDNGQYKTTCTPGLKDRLQE